MMGVRKYGQRLPLWIQRLRSVDALESAQKYMDHPLIIETMRECLENIFDIPNTISVLKDIEAGKIKVFEKKTWYPSPFASEILFQFQQEFLYMEKAPHPGNNDYPSISGPEALNLSYRKPASETVLRDDAVLKIIENNNTKYKFEKVNSSNELHSFLLIYGDIDTKLFTGIFKDWSNELLQNNRIVLTPKGLPRYIAVEEISLYSVAEGAAIEHPDLQYISKDDNSWTQDDAISRILRRYARYNSPFTLANLVERYPYTNEKCEKILARLRSEGYLIFLEEHKLYYHSTIYDRAARLSINMAADEIKTRDACALSSLLIDWHKIGSTSVSLQDRLYEVVTQLEGLYLPVESWENIVFPARINGYAQNLLDKLCASGMVTWRISPLDSITDIKLAWFKVESISLEENEPAFMQALTNGENEAASNQVLTNEECGNITSPALADKKITNVSFRKSDDEDNKDTLSQISTDMKNKNVFTPELTDNEKTIYMILKRKGACFTHVLTSLSNFSASVVLDILRDLVLKGLVVNDSFQPVRYFLNKKVFEAGNSMQKARHAARMVSGADLGRWELSYPPKKLSVRDFIHLCGLRYGLITKEINSLEQSPYTWSEVYEVLKLMEYAGEIHRGYFFKGISGIQFMFPDSLKKLSLENDSYIVLNACDPAQPYGRIIPHSEHSMQFSCVPSNAVVLYNGEPVLLMERHGEKLTFNGDSNILLNSVTAFKNAFQEKRLWPEKKRIIIKSWPEDEEQKVILKSALTQAGFISEIDKMVLWGKRS